MFGSSLAEKGLMTWTLNRHFYLTTIFWVYGIHTMDIPSKTENQSFTDICSIYCREVFVRKNTTAISVK